jgi:hypothetical protein
MSGNVFLDIGVPNLEGQTTSISQDVENRLLRVHSAAPESRARSRTPPNARDVGRVSVAAGVNIFKRRRSP